MSHLALASEEIAATRDACVHFGPVVALAPTTIELRRGESVALVGANGSGKTTLLSLLAGLRPATDGDVLVGGTVAMVTQHHEHHRWMPLSVDEVLRMGRYGARRLLGRLGSGDRQVLTEMAERLEVQHLRRRAFGDLSGGQQQRVLVAQALAAEPALLLLDEPITGLDLPSQLRILEVIADQAAAGGTVVFSTHHLAEARRADRVLLMAGCVLADGSPESVLVPGLLAEAFGGRVIRDDGSSIVVDEHGHHDDHTAHTHVDLVTHQILHPHQHDHVHDQPDRQQPHDGRRP